MKRITRKTIIKKAVDDLDKLSIGALLLGIFQFNYYASIVGIGALFLSYYLTYSVEEEYE